MQKVQDIMLAEDWCRGGTWVVQGGGGAVQGGARRCRSGAGRCRVAAPSGVDVKT